MTKLRKRPPQEVDVQVGQRIRMRRLMLGMSQTTLASQLGITFQQVQKYEKGANRIGAGRLQQIASKLDVPVSFLFDDAAVPGGDSQFRDDLQSLFTTRDGLDLAAAFQKIRNPKLKRRIVDLVERISAIGSE